MYLMYDMIAHISAVYIIVRNRQISDHWMRGIRMLPPDHLLFVYTSEGDNPDDFVEFTIGRYTANNAVR
jgi:hypothetical protein